jgi:hypothetical protein
MNEFYWGHILQISLLMISECGWELEVNVDFDMRQGREARRLIGAMPPPELTSP